MPLCVPVTGLVAALNRLNARCFTPSDRYRTLSALGSAIGRPYLARIHTHTHTLRAKGTLISESRLSTPCESLRHAISPTHFKGICFKIAIFPASRGKNRMSQGVESRGSLTCVPLAVRETIFASPP